jgi:hypothetical protein
MDLQMSTPEYKYIVVEVAILYLGYGSFPC